MTATQSTWLSGLQALVTNPVDLQGLREGRLAGILGDAPSTYAKSPRLWNAAFKALRLDAAYVPLDAPRERLRRVVQHLRESDRFLGGSVTVPYKTEIIPLLDEVDPLTERIGAVNVIERTPDGRLIGHNTDGIGGVQALSEARQADLAGARVLLIGAGGAARALACVVWEQIADGELVIANRTRARATELIQRLSSRRAGRLGAIEEEGIAEQARDMDVIINATVKGQAGIRALPDGRRTILEPFSCLAPAQPAALEPIDEEAVFRHAWFRRSAAEIQRNQARSLELCAQLPQRALCYDIIYAPPETTFLRHARLSGHPTLNGKRMNLLQAVEALTRHVCRDWFARLGLDRDATTQSVTEAMGEAWA